MKIPRVTVLIVPYLLTLGVSCSSSPESHDSAVPPLPDTLPRAAVPAQPPQSPDWGRPKFTSYDRAIAWVRANKERDDQLVASPGSWFTGAEYYLDAGKGYLIVRTRAGEVILENVAPSSIWRVFRDEPTRENFKYLQERYALTVVPYISATGAMECIQDYYQAIDAHRYRDAYERWARGGRASGKNFEEFQKGFVETGYVDVGFGTPGHIEGAAGSRYIQLPVRLLARMRAGEQQLFWGTYTLRLSVVDGATPEQRTWHIESAAVRRVR